jgi:hypothetical protein
MWQATNVRKTDKRHAVKLSRQRERKNSQLRGIDLAGDFFSYVSPTDYRRECATNKVDSWGVAIVVIERTHYLLEEMVLDHSLICYDVAVKLL